MHLEELIATLIAAVNTNTSSLDENNRLLRAAGASAAPAEPAAPKTRKTKAAPEPEPTPEPPAEPEPPTLDAPDEMDEPEEDTADYLDMTRQMVMAFRKANPDKAPTNKAEYAKILAKFGVGNLAEVPKEKSKDFFLAVKEIC